MAAGETILQAFTVFFRVDRDDQHLTDPLCDELERRGRVVITDQDRPDPETPWILVLCLWGNNPDRWAQLPDQTAAPCLGSVVLTDHHHVGTYARSYRASAAVAQVDSPVAAAADVIDARARGEILSPAALLPSLIDFASTPPLALLGSELLVLRGIAQGMTLAQVAKATSYSERHVRRIAQSIFAKAGTNNRREVTQAFSHLIT